MKLCHASLHIDLNVLLNLYIIKSRANLRAHTVDGHNVDYRLRRIFMNLNHQLSYQHLPSNGQNANGCNATYLKNLVQAQRTYAAVISSVTS